MWSGGSRIDPYGEAGLPIYSGGVQGDGSKLVRRTLSNVRVDATDATWDLLAGPGTELRCFRGFSYSNGERELIPIGRFVLDDFRETYGGDWDGAIGTAPDIMARVQKARFLTPRTWPAGTVISTIITNLIEEVLGPVTNVCTSRDALPSTAVYERDRAKTITDLAASIGATVYASPDGTPMVTDQPQISVPAWTVGPGDGGVLYEATRSRSLAQAYSVVVANKTAVDGAAPFPPQIVYDDEPNSPTYYRGAFGEVPYFMSSEFFSSPDQALRAAQARLPLVTAPRAQQDLTVECNPALEAFDTLEIVLPKRREGQRTITERALVGTFTVPLTADGTQSLTTISPAAAVADSN